MDNFLLKFLLWADDFGAQPRGPTPHFLFFLGGWAGMAHFPLKFRLWADDFGGQLRPPISGFFGGGQEWFCLHPHDEIAESLRLSGLCGHCTQENCRASQVVWTPRMKIADSLRL